MPARPRAPPPAALDLPEPERQLPAPPSSSSPLESGPTAPSSASASSTSYISIPAAIRRPTLPSSASYDSTRSADDEPTPWGGGGGGGSVGSASSPHRGLASKFASLMARTTGQPQAIEDDDGFKSSLSSEELERQAMEDRDRSRREAEALLAMDDHGGPGELNRGAGGTIKAPKAANKERGPFFDATNSPSPRGPPADKHAPLDPSLPHPNDQTPTRAKPSRLSSTQSSVPSSTSPYLVPRAPDSPTLDVEASLSSLANRFAKLEAWTVGHVRALEERAEVMETRVRAAEERGSEVGTVRRELGELRGAMREGFRAIEEMHLPREPTRQVSAPVSVADKVKEEKRPKPLAPSPAAAAASTPPLSVTKRASSISAASSTPITAPSSAIASPKLGNTTPLASKPSRTFAPVTTTAPLRTSHRSTVSISSLPHPASTQSFLSTPPTITTPRSSSPSGSYLAKPTPSSSLLLPRSTSPASSLPPSASAPTSPAPAAARKRYTVALGDRSSTTSSPGPLEPSTANNTAPLPTSSTFKGPPRSATTLLGPGTTLPEGKAGVNRRRSRSVGGLGAMQEEIKEGAGEVKASDRRRAPVGSLIGFWDKS